MAITNARLQMRRGKEQDYDPTKMMPGEWAVSLDTKYVRMCFAPGECLRMATYEAFEQDMAEILRILEECRDIRSAVELIRDNITDAELVIENYVAQAKQYRDEAEQFKNEAEAIVGIGIATTEKAGIVKPDGTTITVDEDGTIHSVGGAGGTDDYTELENKPLINGVELSGNKTLPELGIASNEDVSKLNTKVDTIIDKAELNIKNTASGETIHLTDSADSKIVGFALHGKAEQKRYSGKNLLDNTATTQTINGVTYTVNNDGSVTANGTATDLARFDIGTVSILKDTGYILSGCPSGGAYGKYRQVLISADLNYPQDAGNGVSFTPTADENNTIVVIQVYAGQTVNNLTFYPMVRLASITDSTYEPYTGGMASPSPDYPQDIEVAGESYNLLENTATSQTVNGVTFDVNKNKSVTVNGLNSDNNIDFILSTMMLKKGNTYVLSDSIDGSVIGVPSEFNIAVRRSDNKSYLISVYTGMTYTPTEDIEVEIMLRVYKGKSINNVTFYPMLRKASVKNDRYMPYGVGSIEVTTSNEDDTETTKSLISTPDGLASVGGVYDEIIKYADGSGKRIQRIGLIDSYNGESITTNYLSTTGQLTTGAKILYELATPIITDLTSEEIAEIEKLRTFYPATNISNDADCGMAVMYIADSKAYIDNQLALQAQAQEETLLNMLLLMPEEVQASMIENDTNNLLNEAEV